jgi:hypothetical protein
MAATSTAMPDGNVLLARCAKLNRPPNSYSVPLSFAVHLLRPFSVHFKANAIVYFESPDKQALVITSLPRMIGRLFSRSYAGVDTIPQKWSGRYHVFSTTLVDHDGAPAYLLDTTPTYVGEITHVTFELLENGLVPVGVEWFYNDGSTIRLTVVNARIDGYVLPQHEEISVVMRRYAVDARGDSGTYAINVPVDDSVFEKP